MEEVCKVGPKNLRKKFRVCYLFLVILVMSAPKPDNFMQLF